MARTFDIADSITSTIQAIVAANIIWPTITTLVGGMTATGVVQVGIQPVKEKIQIGPAQFYLSPVRRELHDGESFDACSDQWKKMFYLSFVYNMTSINRSDDFPSGQAVVRQLVEECAEPIGDWFMENTRIDNVGPTNDVVRLQKDEIEQELFDEEFLRDHVFKTTLTLVYG